MMTKEMAMKDVIDELGVKETPDKTDAEFDRDDKEYNRLVGDEWSVGALDTLESDMLTHYKELDADMYFRLRQIDLLKTLIKKLDNLEMLYDVHTALKELNDK